MVYHFFPYFSRPTPLPPRVNAPHPTPTPPCSRSNFLSHPRNTNIWSSKAMCAVMGRESRGGGGGGGCLPFQASMGESWLRAPKAGCGASVGRGPAFVLARFLMPSSSARCVSILHSKPSNRENICISHKCHLPAARNGATYAVRKFDPAVSQIQM